MDVVKPTFNSGQWNPAGSKRVLLCPREKCKSLSLSLPFLVNFLKTNLFQRVSLEICQNLLKRLCWLRGCNAIPREKNPKEARKAK